MKTTVLFISIALLSITTINAQWWGNSKKIKGDGNMVTKTRSVSDYDQIKVKGSLDVSLISGTEGQLKIEGESNLIEYIVTEVEDESLKIYVKKGYYLKQSTGKKLVITVPFKDISVVSLSGSGDINSTDTIKADDFKTGLSGSGDISLSLDAKNVSSAVSGSGDIVLRGSSDSFVAKVSGSGDLQAFDLKAKDVTAAVAGSGDVEVTATSSIKARVSGSGDIYYRGNPAKEDKKVSGSGDITKR